MRGHAAGGERFQPCGHRQGYKCCCWEANEREEREPDVVEMMTRYATKGIPSSVLEPDDEAE